MFNTPSWQIKKIPVYIINFHFAATAVAIGDKLVGPHGDLQVGKCRAFGAPINRSVPLSIILMAAIGAKLIGSHGGLRVGKWAVNDGQALWNDPYVAYMTE